MIVFQNGEYREATDEEIKKSENRIIEKAGLATNEERINNLEQLLADVVSLQLEVQ